MSDRKTNFAVTLPLKLFRATVANSDTGSLKSPHTLFDTYLYHMLAKFEPNGRVRNVQNLELYEKPKQNKTKNKNEFIKPFLTKR